MEQKKPFITEVKIDGEIYPLYNIEIKGKSLNVASPSLNKKIEECIDNGDYFNEICEMDGKVCTVEVVDNTYCYVFGDEENLNPTMEEVIESIEDVILNENRKPKFYVPQEEELKQLFKDAIRNNALQLIYLDKQTNEVCSLVHIDTPEGKHVVTDGKKALTYDEFNRYNCFDGNVTDVVLINYPAYAVRCKINGVQMMAEKLDAKTLNTLKTMQLNNYPNNYIYNCLRLKAAEIHVDLLNGIEQSQKQGRKL